MEESLVGQTTISEERSNDNETTPTTTTTMATNLDESRADDSSDDSQTTTGGLKKSTSTQLNTDCLEYIQKNSSLIFNSLAFLFDVTKREAFFKSLSSSSVASNNNNSLDSNQSGSMMSDPSDSSVSNSLARFIQLYVPLDYMKHMSMQSKLNMITQFLLTNKTDETKIELIVDLANHYAQKQEWRVVLDLLNGCTQDNEEFNDLMARTTDPTSLVYSMYYGNSTNHLSNPRMDNLKDFFDLNRGQHSSAGVNKNINFNENCNAK